MTKHETLGERIAAHFDHLCNHSPELYGNPEACVRMVWKESELLGTVAIEREVINGTWGADPFERFIPGPDCSIHLSLADMASLIADETYRPLWPMIKLAV